MLSVIFSPLALSSHTSEVFLARIVMPFSRLEVAGVHDPLVDFFVCAERTGLLQHGIDEGGLAVVDVRDDREVSDVGTRRDGARICEGGFGGRHG